MHLHLRNRGRLPIRLDSNISGHWYVFGRQKDLCKDVNGEKSWQSPRWYGAQAFYATDDIKVSSPLAEGTELVTTAPLSYDTDESVIRTMQLPLSP